jgi:hypothetical protein
VLTIKRLLHNPRRKAERRTRSAPLPYIYGRWPMTFTEGYHCWTLIVDCDHSHSDHRRHRPEHETGLECARWNAYLGIGQLPRDAVVQ